LHAGDDDHQARPLDAPEPSQLEHHTALVLPQDADRVEQRRSDEYDDDGAAADAFHI
jgi:hypothetical protein